MARTVVEPALLSGCTSGQAIKITTTASPGNTIHTAHATKTDRIYLSVYNSHSATVELFIQWGNTTSGEEIRQTIKFRAGLELVVAGLPLTGGLVVKAYASIADKLLIFGEVERAALE